MNPIFPRALAALALALSACGAQALQITQLTPQGEVARVRQLVTSFDTAAVDFGDPKAGAPLLVQCDDAAAAQGSGRWLNDRRWVFEFAQDLPPGVRCNVSAAPGFRPAAGGALKGRTSFQFNTGGPFVRNHWPSYGDIDEDQAFVLELNGAAAPASVLQHVSCALEAPAERVPVALLEGARRAALLKATDNEKAAAQAPQRFVVLQCKRRLTPGSKMQLVWGKGVATPSGIANKVEKRLRFAVREPFAVEFTCERENAHADCLPLRDMRLRFTAPVQQKLAAKIVLKGGGKSFAPKKDDDVAGDDALVESIRFAAPLAEQTTYTIELPPGFQDDSGRTPAPDAFPLKVATGPMPPLAKFAAAPFGVIERLAEPGGVALLPVTLRRVEAALNVQELSPGQVSDLRPQTDTEIIAWYRKVKRYDNNSSVERDDARKDVKGPLPKVINAADKTSVETRMLSLLAGQPGVKTIDLPRANADPRPMEVIGIPLAPGFHVLEIASQKLGDTLLDEDYGSGRTMFVRTTALATNLAVHFKLGRENSLAWVTTLDQGAVVANAAVQVSDCRGKALASGRTDANGMLRLQGISPTAPDCDRVADEGPDDAGGSGVAYFVSARATDAKGVQDLAFVWSDWQRGIEPWRFGLPTSSQATPDVVAHTVLDRTLLRAGETVSMKHLIRSETADGFGLPRVLPRRMVITHVGSGQEYEQPLAWRKTAGGARSAESTFAIPASAKLGSYSIELRAQDAKPNADARESASTRSYASGSFRVEEFRLPVLQGRIGPLEKQPLVAVAAVPTAVQVDYVAGGAAARLPVRVSALLREERVHFADHDKFTFNPPQRDDDNEAEPGGGQGPHVVADKLPLTLDANGAGQVTVEPLPKATAPRELLLEASYADPNGEVQTISSTQTLWPAAVIAGIRTQDWVSVGDKLRFQALALDLAGKPLAGVPIEVKAVAHITTSSRKRLVGGFYSYDNKTSSKPLATVCNGKSDSRGLLLCEATLPEPGRVELIASAKDDAGRASLAASSVYVTRRGEVWFGGEDHDRIDLLPEKKAYAGGEMAKFQVRSPFRSATALVTVEREGVLEAQVVQLEGKDPTISLQVKPEWAPNAYVSVLVLRGRLHEVPWYSFFTWGWRSPRQWWTAFRYEGKAYVAPTTLVDLSKPAYRIGAAEIRVGDAAHRIQVAVSTDQPRYTVRSKAQVTIHATLPDGKPAAGAEVALAAVDQALLELMPNNSWNLLEAMLQRRSWGVSTSTAQMEIVGRRHYGRKAVPAGGGGGNSSTRELLDTLLLWNPRVLLDEKGEASLTVPLNDSLTTFRIVAVADAGLGLFGTGQATIAATQDLQIISGLPPLVREDDQFSARFTLRNTTDKAMKVQVRPRATLLDLAPQSIDLPAGQAREVAWDVTAPAQLTQTRAEAILWEIEAQDRAEGSGGARDALKVRQRIVPAVPLTVQQGTLVQLGSDAPFQLAVAPPAGALSGRGGLRLSLVPRLAEGLPGVRDWFARYPYTCLEQKVSKAVGLRDPKAFAALMAQLPGYLDADGLANYFPPRDGQANRGSDVLTAYLLAAGNEASDIDPAYAIPQAPRELMQAGLIAFVEGRLQRDFWSPRKDLDVRKLAALEALSRYGKATGRMTGSIAIAPNQWPTSAVLDWLGILQRVKDVPQRAQRLAQAEQILKARLSYQGTRLAFSTEQDDNWWWLMVNGDVNGARLLLAVLDDPAWKEDLGRLAGGFIARQQNGAWHTTSANLWGSLALEKFSRAFESTPVTGVTAATLGAARAQVDWSRIERVKASDDSGAPNQASAFGAPAATGNLRHNGMFLPWQAGKATLEVVQQGDGRPWLTLQSLAAVPLKMPFAAGFAIRKTVTPVEQADKSLPPGSYTRGDILRITLEVNASTGMTWVALTDPIPAGATILGSGLGRDSQLATQGEKHSERAQPVFEERSFEAWRGYYDYLPKGVTKVEYTVRLNNSGDFAQPPSRAEALYAPEMSGEAPNPRVKVLATK